MIHHRMVCMHCACEWMEDTVRSNASPVLPCGGRGARSACTARSRLRQGIHKAPDWHEKAHLPQETWRVNWVPEKSSGQIAVRTNTSAVPQLGVSLPGTGCPFLGPVLRRFFVGMHLKEPGRDGGQTPSVLSSWIAIGLRNSILPTEEGAPSQAISAIVHHLTCVTEAGACRCTLKSATPQGRLCEHHSSCDVWCQQQRMNCIIHST